MTNTKSWVEQVAVEIDRVLKEQHVPGAVYYTYTTDRHWNERAVIEFLVLTAANDAQARARFHPQVLPPTDVAAQSVATLFAREFQKRHSSANR